MDEQLAWERDSKGEQPFEKEVVLSEAESFMFTPCSMQLSRELFTPNK